VQSGKKDDLEKEGEERGGKKERRGKGKKFENKVKGWL
jgi:hypothetical protein